MKIASWNVNSLKVRLAQVLDWLSTEKPDILCLQETKTEDQNFPTEALKEAGWHSCYSGQKAYNGVAIVSRIKPDEIKHGLATFEDPQKRLIGAQYNGLWVFSVYVPNGESLTSPKFAYKLDWLSHLTQFLEKAAQQPLVIAGDFNIAPDDRDVYDPNVWSDRILVSDDERKALDDILSLGYVDTFRLFDQPTDEFSWWDYRTRGFLRNRGLRLDLILASAPLQSKCQKAWIDKEPRAADRPSDHTPVLLELDWPA